MSSNNEVNSACEQAHEANSENMEALFKGYMERANDVGALLFDCARLVRGAPHESVRRGFEQTAKDLGTALGGSEDPHLVGAMNASRQAATNMEALPGLCETVDKRLKAALDAVGALQEGIGAVQLEGYRLGDHLEKRPQL